VHGSWLHKLKGYWKLDGVSNESLDNWLLSLVTQLKPRIYIPREHIITKDELPYKMFILRRGLVGRLGRVLTETNSPVFGEDVVLYRYGLRRNYNAVAMTYVETFSVTYPEVYELMSDVFKEKVDSWTRRLVLCRMLILAAKDPDALRRSREWSTKRRSILVLPPQSPSHSPGTTPVNSASQVGRSRGSVLTPIVDLAGLAPVGGHANDTLNLIVNAVQNGIAEMHREIKGELTDMRQSMSKLQADVDSIRNSNSGTAESSADDSDIAAPTTPLPPVRRVVGSVTTHTDPEAAGHVGGSTANTGPEVAGGGVCEV